MTSVLELLMPRTIDNPDELTSMLESLPSYDNLTQNSDEPAVFADEQEPPTGLINLIRKNSDLEEEEPINMSNIVRMKMILIFFLLVFL
jgi:hypothetical protein